MFVCVRFTCACHRLCHNALTFNRCQCLRAWVCVSNFFFWESTSPKQQERERERGPAHFFIERLLLLICIDYCGLVLTRNTVRLCICARVLSCTHTHTCTRVRGSLGALHTAISFAPAKGLSLSRSSISTCPCRRCSAYVWISFVQLIGVFCCTL